MQAPVLREYEDMLYSGRCTELGSGGLTKKREASYRVL